MAVLLAIGVQGAPEGVKFYEGSWKQTLEEAGKSKKLVFVDFYTEW